MRPRLAALLLAAAALAGCGVGPGEGTTDVSVTVTRDFGATAVAPAVSEQVPAEETVMRLLQRRFDVKTRYGGGFVQGIEGLEGGTSGARRVDWFFYVNGIEAEQGAASRKLHDGDRVWWDHHDWGATMRVPAVVGAFPEPFLSGADGRKLPVRLDCAPDVQRECDEVARRLDANRVRAASKATIGAPSGIHVLRIVVGTWEAVRRDPTAVLLERGPAVSGVFARPDRTASRIDLLDERGRVDHALGPGGGLVAATRYQEQEPTWIVTGVDPAGVAAAASALEEGVLKDRFAVAVEDGRSLPLPVRPQR